MRTLNKKIFRHANCSVNKPHERVVQSGLALTPHSVKELSEKGIPVNLRNSAQVNDPESFLGDKLPFYLRRDVDLNTAWEMSQQTKKTLIKQYKNNI
ncbi:MAG: hypothetical protein IJA09_06700 [Bacteroidales bacterium]|nr:hypothetical protein [Bacteroidales bacterium]